MGHTPAQIVGTRILSVFNLSIQFLRTKDRSSSLRRGALGCLGHRSRVGRSTGPKRSRNDSVEAWDQVAGSYKAKERRAS